MPEDPSSVTEERTVDDIIKETERFRILVIGRYGVGKTSLINFVFGIDNAHVLNYNPRGVDIESELVSSKNPLFVVHDSRGFEPGNLENFEIVRQFVEDRSKRPHVKDRIHALWLCVETPAVGGRVFETGDEELLKFAQKNELPLVLVLTQYDRLVRTKEFELRNKHPDMDPASRRLQAVEEAQAWFETWLKSLEGLPIQNHVHVSVHPDFQDVSPVSSLVNITMTVTRDQVKGDAWMLWAIAQRGSWPIKVEASITKGISAYPRALADSVVGVEWSLGPCLEKLHKNIIYCWGFTNSEILNNPGFQGMMLQLAKNVVDDVDAERGATNSLTFDIVERTIKLVSESPALPLSTLGLAGLIRKNLTNNFSEARLVFIAYTVDLIKVLIELFERAIKHEFTITWPDLKAAFEAYVSSHSCQIIHESIRSKKRGTTSTADDIRTEIRQMLELN